MPQSFTQKLLELDVTLDPNPTTNAAPFFTPDVTGGIENQNTVTIKGLRTSVRIQYAGLPAGTTAQVAVFGLTPSLMNQLSTLGIVFQAIPHNTLTIRAGDSSGLSTTFIGTIRAATADFNKAPDVPFSFEAIGGLVNQVIPATAFSSGGPVNVVSVMQNLAQKLGYGFENNGVEATLPPSYFPGTLADQYKKVAIDANIRAELVPGSTGNLILAIWPKGGSRKGSIPLLSPSTGMIGYPSYSQVGLTAKTIFNPNIGLGGQVQIQSSLPRATGVWTVLRIDHALDSLVPNGLWESTLSCFNPKYANLGIPVA